MTQATQPPSSCRQCSRRRRAAAGWPAIVLSRRPDHHLGERKARPHAAESSDVVDGSRGIEGQKPTCFTAASRDGIATKTFPLDAANQPVCALWLPCCPFTLMK